MDSLEKSIRATRQKLEWKRLSASVQPEGQMQLWLLSLPFDQTLTAENTHSLAAFGGRRADAGPAAVTSSYRHSRFVPQTDRAALGRGRAEAGPPGGD